MPRPTVPTMLLAAALLALLVTWPFTDRPWSLEQPSQAAHLADETEPTRLAIVWTSGDPDVAHRMAFMYTHASQKNRWFDRNLVIVWGPSAKLLAEDETLQAKVKEMQADGVQFQACVVCADLYGVADELRALDIEVKPMGKPLTGLLQDDGWDVMTF